MNPFIPYPNMRNKIKYDLSFSCIYLEELQVFLKKYCIFKVLYIWERIGCRVLLGLLQVTGGT